MYYSDEELLKGSDEDAQTELENAEIDSKISKRQPNIIFTSKDSDNININFGVF